MAIAIDSATDSAPTSASTTHTVSHTTGSGADRVIVVCVVLNEGTAGNRIVSTVTYNGVGLTQQVSQDEGAGASNDNAKVEVWTLVAPASGAHDVVVTCAGACDDIYAFVSTWTGVDQTTPVEDTDSSAPVDTNSPSHPALASTTDNAFAVDVICGQHTTSQAPQTGQTRIGLSRAFQTSGFCGASYEGPITPAGAITMGWDTAEGNDDHLLASVVLAPSAEGANKPPRRRRVMGFEAIQKAALRPRRY